MPSRPVFCLVRTVAILALFIGVASSALAAEAPYNEVGVLKGQIIIVNHPQLGRTPATGMYFLLQRVDCRRCLVGVRTDIDGRYTVFLGIGKYRIYCSEPEGGREDLLRKSQSREVTVQRPPTDTEFDIELELPGK